MLDRSQQNLFGVPPSRVPAPKEDGAPDTAPRERAAARGRPASASRIRRPGEARISGRGLSPKAARRRLGALLEGMWARKRYLPSALVLAVLLADLLSGGGGKPSSRSAALPARPSPAVSEPMTPKTGARQAPIAPAAPRRPPRRPHAARRKPGVPARFPRSRRARSGHAVSAPPRAPLSAAAAGRFSPRDGAPSAPAVATLSTSPAAATPPSPPDPASADLTAPASSGEFSFER